MALKITWTDNNAGEQGHRIYISDQPLDPDNLPPPHGETGPDVTEYMALDVDDGAAWHIIVSAFRGSTEVLSEPLHYDPEGTLPLGILVFPLTFDEMDSDHQVALERLGGAGPHVTPAGFEGDGYEARYKTDSLPPWVNSGEVSLQFSAAVPNLRARSARDELVSLCADDATADVRMGFAVMEDDKGSVRVPAGAIKLVAGTTAGPRELFLGRPGWGYVLRTPSPTVGQYPAKLQAVHFIDQSTMVFSAHLDDTESVFYRVDLADNSITGEFTLGSSYRHVASMAERSNGDVWVGDYETGTLLRIDLGASFVSGSAVILDSCDASSIIGTGAIAFMTISGEEYLVMGQYSTIEENGYLYLFSASVLSQPSIVAADRFKRFMLGRRMQGIVERNGRLLLARNSLRGDAGAGGVVGWIQELDLAGMVESLADGSAVHSTANSGYITAQYVGPASYVEDLAVHPTTNEVYAPTEGGYGVIDYPGFQGIWRSDLADRAALNHYSAEYDGVGTVVVKLNGYTFATMAWELDQVAEVLTIGGLPAAASGFTNGYSLGTIANVALVNGSISDALFDAIADGDFEQSSLQEYSLFLLNPGAETGDVSSWTAEVGSLDVRDFNPPAYEGIYYFSAGPNPATRARQRLDLTQQGLPSGVLDSGGAWAKVRWQQSAYSDQDPGGMGLRALTSADATLDEQYSGSDWTPFGGGASGPWYWYPRCYAMDLPANTRKLDAIYNAGPRTAGTNNDLYVDIITVTVYAR